MATHCRSTLLVASKQALREHGWSDAYRRAAPPELLQTIEAAGAGVSTWLPIDVAAAHYRTCDALGISLLEQIDIGGAVNRRLHQSLLGALVRVARASGAVSPLTALLRFNQIHARTWMGSAGRLVELGPKDFRLDVVGLPLVDIPYFRAAYRGFLRAGAHLFTDHAFVTEVPADARAQHAVSYRFAWA